MEALLGINDKKLNFWLSHAAHTECPPRQIWLTSRLSLPLSLSVGLDKRPALTGCMTSWLVHLGALFRECCKKVLVKDNGSPYNVHTPRHTHMLTNISFFFFGDGVSVAFASFFFFFTFFLFCLGVMYNEKGMDESNW